MKKDVSRKGAKAQRREEYPHPRGIAFGFHRAGITQITLIDADL